MAVYVYYDSAQMTSKHGNKVYYEPQASSMTDVLTMFQHPLCINRESEVESRYFRYQRYASMTEGHTIGVQCYCIVIESPVVTEKPRVLNRQRSEKCVLYEAEEFAEPSRTHL